MNFPFNAPVLWPRRKHCFIKVYGLSLGFLSEGMFRHVRCGFVGGILELNVWLRVRPRYNERLVALRMGFDLPKH